MATAGSIVIDLLMRTGAFETDSKRAEKRLKQFKKEAEEAGKAIGVAVVAAGTAITALVKTSIDTMDELSKAAQRSNTTTEQFSKLAYGAGLADVSIQDLQGSLGKLAKAQGDALDAGSEQAKVFRALGIEVKNADGSLRDTTAVLEDFADRFFRVRRFGLEPLHDAAVIARRKQAHEEPGVGLDARSQVVGFHLQHIEFLEGLFHGGRSG